MNALRDAFADRPFIDQLYLARRKSGSERSGFSVNTQLRLGAYAPNRPRGQCRSQRSRDQQALEATALSTICIPMKIPETQIRPSNLSSVWDIETLARITFRPPSYPEAIIYLHDGTFAAIILLSFAY